LVVTVTAVLRSWLVMVTAHYPSPPTLKSHTYDPVGGFASRRHGG
jgi:hypothetical protein